MVRPSYDTKSDRSSDSGMEEYKGIDPRKQSCRPRFPLADLDPNIDLLFLCRVLYLTPPLLAPLTLLC